MAIQKKSLVGSGSTASTVKTTRVTTVSGRKLETVKAGLQTSKAGLHKTKAGLFRHCVSERGI